MPTTWRLEPVPTGVSEPGCPHCLIPGYPHRHWRQHEVRAEARRDGPVMRLLMRVWGDGGQDR